MSSPLPLRILVKGASTVNWSSPMGGPRTDFTFPRVVEERLLVQGRPSIIQTYSVPSEKTAAILSTWEQQVLGFSPDVVILVFGHYETIHLFLPRWLERHANSLRASPRPWNRRYRQHVLRPVWKVLARIQAAVDQRIDPTIGRHRPRHVAADLTEYIRQVRKVGSPLVYVFELLPPASRYRAWFPGMARRMEVMNSTLATMVADIDCEDVRYFRVSELVEEHVDGDLDVAIADGFHYTPHMHRKIGEALAEDIGGWAAAQPHLVVRVERP